MGWAKVPLGRKVPHRAVAPSGCCGAILPPSRKNPPLEFSFQYELGVRWRTGQAGNFARKARCPSCLTTPREPWRQPANSTNRRGGLESSKKTVPQRRSRKEVRRRRAAEGILQPSELFLKQPPRDAPRPIRLHVSGRGIEASSGGRLPHQERGLVESNQLPTTTGYHPPPPSRRERQDHASRHDTPDRDATPLPTGFLFLLTAMPSN